MKRWFTMLLAVSLVLCMAGCASQSELDALKAENEKLQTTVEKYSDLIDAMEAEDYEAAIEAVIGYMPEEAAPAYHKVEITTDNFFDYFERTMYTSYEKKSQFGTVSDKGVCDGFVLKPQYAEKLVSPFGDVYMFTDNADDTESKVSVRLSVTTEMYSFDIDEETGDLTILEPMSDSVKKMWYYPEEEQQEKTVTSDFLWGEDSMENDGVQNLRIDLQYYGTIYDGNVYEGDFYGERSDQKYAYIQAIDQVDVQEVAGYLYLYD